MLHLKYAARNTPVSAYINSITTVILTKLLDYTTSCVTGVFTLLLHFHLYHSGMHGIPKRDVNMLTEAVHEVIPNAPPFFLASNKARSEILLVQIRSSLCLCMKLSKIHSAAWSQQLPHVFRGYFAPILRISLVINSRRPYALSHMSLTTDCILATQLRQHRVLQGVATSSKNVSYYKHCGSVKSLQILWPKHASEQLCTCK